MVCRGKTFITLRWQGACVCEKHKRQDRSYIWVDLEGHLVLKKSATDLIFRKSESMWSVQFSRSVMSNSLWPHGLQHARPPYPSPTPGVYSNSCPSSWWWHPTTSSSVVPFSSCLQSFPESGSFPVSHFFASGGQSIGVFSFSISPSNEYSGLISFRMDWLDLLAVQGIQNT